ncbi:right-handed parallel beta-helix repeat-containing protein [Corallococcus exercitus]|uniref:Right-handed parallel beta-helix repeat-containing protein n=1 Tax=Corallococcus exercitus TaxID=2316736 RepID=A0A7Y4JUE8_9BACT|nr:right-handed parallel beta-helix repeat-containing protein [Corallococcus exercitus]NOK11088.1 right-handed parallel beta-helix repeat-containing protein [Corallococcus exercitus]
MTVKAYTSRSRFDEARRFSGVYQQMGRMSLDADWNEEVRLRTVDARRRSADVAEGSPDDGFRIVDTYLVDPIRNVLGWTGQGLPVGDERTIPRELRLDRYDSETLPFVVRSRGHIALRRTLPAPLDLTAVPRSDGTDFTASALVIGLRFERPPTDDEIIDLRVVVADTDGHETIISAGLGQRPSGWNDVRFPVSAFADVDPAKLSTWGVLGLPPVARTWVSALRVEDAALGADIIIRGGDGTLPGSGRMLLDGVRIFLEQDLRYSAQPDLPEATPLAALPTDGTLHHFFFLDCWEQTTTHLDDAFLEEPALDGQDTTVRLRLVTQVRALQGLAATDAEVLPTPTSGARLTTNIPKGALPDRFPPEPLDPCRDRCLATENASTGEGYVGSDNLHFRVEFFQGGAQPVVLWSRDNGSTVLPLTAPAAADAMTLQVSPESAMKLRAGDLVVIEDRVTRLQPEGPSLPVLRRLRGVQADTGKLELADASAVLTTDPVPFAVGGTLGRAFSPTQGAAVRRWDGGDLLVPNVRYRFDDGITLAFANTEGRATEYWSFTVRVRAADGAARGEVEQLTDAPVHGPVHHCVPLARVTGGAVRTFEDLRPRYLPLAQVRDRLVELSERVVGPGVFTVVVGDGVRSFGDVDQDLLEGITGDEALQAAVDRMGGQGGSIFVRSGRYKLEHPVLLRNLSSVHLLGDGESTELRTQGSGGAFFVDRCGLDGDVRIEDFKLVEAPFEDVVIGEGLQPVVRVVTKSVATTDGRRFVPLAEVDDDRVLEEDDVKHPSAEADFVDVVADRIKVIAPGQGRAAGSVVATLVQLRKLQRLHPGQPLEDVPEAKPLLDALATLPHGVVTLADSSGVTLRRCLIQANQAGSEATGVLVTGTCERIVIDENRVGAATGIAVAPYAPYLAERFLASFPRAGLFVDALAITNNRLQPLGDATTGIHVADGRLAGVEVRGNRIQGFQVGILVQDLAEGGLAGPVDRVVVEENQILECAAVGIQVAGDGVDVAGNEIRNAASDGLFQVGIQLSGRALRVRDCWISLPAVPAASVLGVVAGIVVGDGLDDGASNGRPASDVEVVDNRIEGDGESTPGVGILLGGPHPVFDVRIRGNVVRALGDAAVRTWGTGGAVGRLRIEENRFEQVALADVPSQTDNTLALSRLDPGLEVTLSADARARPRPLVEALLANATTRVRAPLDAALRWLEQLTLRGAVVLAGVDEAQVRGNRLLQVGRTQAYGAPGLPDAEVRAAGIAVVSGSGITVEGNEVDGVHAPVTTTQPPPVVGPVKLPPITLVLQQLSVTSSTVRPERADVHGAVVGMYATVLQYSGANEDGRQKIGRGLYGPLDTLAQELRDIGTTPDNVIDALVSDVADMRSAQGFNDHTQTSHAVRSSLARACSFTAPDDVSQAAWDTVAQFDLATVSGKDAVLTTADRLKGALDSLVQGLPATVKDAFVGALGRVQGGPDDLTALVTLAGALSQVAQLREAQAQRARQPVIGQAVGPKRTIIGTFAQAALQQLPLQPGTRGAKANADVLLQLRQSKEALSDQLQELHPALASQVEADYRDVERTGGQLQPVVDRMRATLKQVLDFTTGQLPPTDVTPEDGARIAAQGRTATIGLYAANLDRQAAGLVTESDDTVEKQLRAFGTAVGQLGELVSGDAELSTLSLQAHQAVVAAIAQPQSRLEQVAIARGLLDRIRVTTLDVLPVLPMPPSPVPVKAEPLERWVSALGALVLAMRGLAAGPVLSGSLQLYLTQYDRVLDIAGVQGKLRVLALKRVSEAVDALDTDSGTSSAAAIQALHLLVDEPATLAEQAVAKSSAVTAELQAAAVLLRAVEQALDPAEDDASRVARLKEYLRQRADKVSASLVAVITVMTDLESILAVLRKALEQLARGEAPDPGDVGVPVFDTFPSPADGLFVSGVQGRVRLANNTVRDTVTGITALGAAGHLLTEAPTDPGSLLDVEGNRLEGCAVAGLLMRPDLSVTVVSGNHLFACAGLPTAGEPGLGQAVATLVGSGELVVKGNVFLESGNTLSQAVLHEVAIDWRGETVVRGNTVRHAGSGGGGAGVLVVTDTLPPDLVVKLSRVPFLATDPVPKPGTEGRAVAVNRAPSSVSTLAAVPRVEDLVQLGSLRQQFAKGPVLNRALTVTAPDFVLSQSASTAATRYLSAPAALVRSSLVDFLVKPIPIVPRPLVKAKRGVQVEGNDITARGPALLLLGNGGAVISAAVSGNELRSEGGVGAVYLRRADSTVFSGNRCQCLDAVNVVVLRVEKAPVTFTGNVVLGAETVTPPPPVLRPAWTLPADKLTLQIPVGGGSTLGVPLDQELLLGGLQRRRDVASDAFSTLLAELVTQPPPPQARAEIPSRGVLDQPTVQDVRSKLPATMDVRLGARTLYGIAVTKDDSPTSALKDLVDRVALHADRPEDVQGQVRSVLAAADGDPKKALQLVDKSVLGIDSAASTVKESILNVSVLHEVLADSFYTGGTAGPKPVQDAGVVPLPPEPPPDPYAHSVIILGGSRVAAVGNATTSGVHVQEADAVVELNP